MENDYYKVYGKTPNITELNNPDYELHKKNLELELKNKELQLQINERELAENRLREEKEFSETLINNSIDAILSINKERCITVWNNNMVYLTGIPKKDALGKKLSEVFPAFWDEDVINQVFTGITIVLENKEYLKKGSFYEAYLIPVYNNSREVIGVLGTLHDITEHKYYEAKMLKKNQDLERTNIELERFVDLASHDLKEPLRMVSIYSQLLEKRYAEKLDDDAKRFIRFAVDGVLRMQTLINGLLEYSKIGKLEARFEMINTATVVDAAVQNLKELIADTNTVIKIQDGLPVLKGVAWQLIQLFQNFVENGIKFRKDQNPCISIQCEKKSNFWEFGIEDNGIGIDLQYKERIFIIFQRLHRKEEYPGTGIGLALCKKIVECHGGRIWYESGKSGGTCFKFTLPA